MSGATEPVSEFDRLVAQLVPHEPTADSALPLELVRNAAIGALIVLAGALLAAVLVPSAESIRDGGFFVVGGETTADWAAGLKAAAGPLAALAAALAALDAYLWQRQPTGEWCRYACVAQPWLGLGALGGWLVFVIAVIINLAFWAFVIGALVAVFFGALAIALMVASVRL